MGEPLLPIVAEIGIDKPIGKVWGVLTGAATVPLWLGAMDYQPEVGTTFFMQQDPEKQAAHDTDGATWCDVVALRMPQNFESSWYVPGTEATMVRISLDADGDNRTFVRLLHDGWDDFERDAIEDFYNALADGWVSDVLPNLKRVAETAA